MEKGLVDSENSAEIFEGSSVAILFLISSRYQKISEMEVLLHKESDVYRSNSKEKIAWVVFHSLYKSLLVSDKAQDQVKGKNSSSSEICLGVLALKPQTHPLFP